MVKDKVADLLASALKNLGIKEEELQIQHPQQSGHGDYALNLALKLSKSLKKNPLEVANDIVKNIPENDILAKIEVIKPGFINLFLSPKILLEETKQIITQGQSYGKKSQKKHTVLLEFGQPNTHKIAHAGHLFSYVFGESLARIFENEGNSIIRANYQGDIGLHVAKCLYVVKNKTLKMKSLKTLKEKVDFLQTCYEEGAKLYEKDKKAEKEIDFLTQKLYEKDSDVLQLWEETRKWSLDFYKLFEEKLGIKYDKYYFESETAPVGKKIVLEHVGKIFEESEGALVFRGEKYGLHTRVFVNRFGNPTYEAKDLGLLSLKLKDFSFDQSLITTASEQNEYWRVIIKASELIFSKLRGKLKHLGFGMIRLTIGKMSSRLGTIIDAFSLVDDVSRELQEAYKSTNELAEKLAVSSIKYSFLRSDPYKDISFDLKKSIAREGDSGPYLLYTYVRTVGILNQAEESNFKNLAFTQFNSDEESLLRLLYQFPEVTTNAATLYSPHLISNYLFNLAQTFNQFYQKNPVLKAEGEQKQLRLLLTQGVGQVLKNGLHLLGIETVDRM